MSIDVPTELLTASSGSVGDLVFSRNQHGPYVRARSAPIDPASASQLAVRAALSECVNAWRTVLTATERQDWHAFALAVQTRTALGRSTNAGGLGMYVRSNVPRIQAAVGGSPRVDQAPANRTSAAFTPITRIVLNVVDDTLHPFFAATDPWCTENDAAMLFYASPPQPLTRHFWSGPYRFAANILGSSTAPPSSPATLPLPFPAGAAERVFVRFRLTLSDARLSHAARLPADHLPQVRPVPILATWRPGFPPSATVKFDQLLRDEAHALTPWFLRKGNTAYTPTLVTTAGDDIRLRLQNAGFSPGADIVNYTPPPDDVRSLLTGLLVRVFLSFPLT